MASSVSQTLKRAQRLAKKGQVAEARELYQTVLSRFPDNKRARQGLAGLGRGHDEDLRALIALYNQGRLGDVVAAAGKLADVLAGEPMFHKLRGAAHLGLGQAGAAAECFGAVTRLTPDDPEAHNNLGVARNHLGDFGAAASSLRRAVELRPVYPEAQTNLGNALRHGGERAAAIASFRAAVAADPNYLEAHLCLAETLKDAGDLLAAIETLETVRRLQPDQVETLVNLGGLLVETGDAAAAVACFERAAELRPDSAEVFNNLGNAMIERGDAEAAIESFQRALAIDPGLAVGHNNLGMAQTNAGDRQEAVASIRRALDLRPDYAEAFFNYAGLVEIDAEDPNLDTMRALVEQGNQTAGDQAYLHFALAKAEQDLGDLEASMTHLTAANALRKRDLGYDIDTDRRLFDAIKTYFDTPAPAGEALPQDADAKPVPVFILGMPRSGTTLVEQIVASHSRVFGAGELDFLRLAIEGSGWAGGASRAEAATGIRARYLERVSHLSTADVVTDKMPLNFKWIGFIREALPDAKIVHMQRPAEAVCWSNFKTFFSGGGMGMAFDLQDIAHYHKLHDDLMAFWHQRYPGAVYELDYERLTEDPEAEARNLLAHLELEWEADVLAFHRSKRLVRTASQMQVRRQIYTGSSEEWRRYAEWLRPMLDILET